MSEKNCSDCVHYDAIKGGSKKGILPNCLHENRLYNFALNERSKGNCEEDGRYFETVRELTELQQAQFDAVIEHLKN